MPSRFSRKRKPAHLPVILFGRVPMVGHGKTRLARDVGVITAWQFQRTCLAGAQRRLKAGRCQTPDRFAHDLKQGPGSFGARLHRLLSQGPMIVIGSDVPNLTPADISAARRALHRPGLVVGPSPDGGFWLIGWRGKTLPRDLFHGVRWSSEHTLEDLLKKNPRTRLIHQRADVDTAKDLTLLSK